MKKRPAKGEGRQTYGIPPMRPMPSIDTHSAQPIPGKYYFYLMNDPNYNGNVVVFNVHGHDPKFNSHMPVGFPNRPIAMKDIDFLTLLRLARDNNAKYVVIVHGGDPDRVAEWRTATWKQFTHRCAEIPGQTYLTVVKLMHSDFFGI